MTSHTITIEPAGWTFSATEDQSLLAAAEAAGIVLPSSCRNGSCRTCRCAGLAGSVGYLIEWPGLSLDEKRAGELLPCVAVARSDLLLSVPAARKAG